MAMYMIRRRDGALEGPYSSSQLRALAAEGQLHGKDEIAVGGTSRWTAAHRVGGIKDILERASFTTSRASAEETESDSTGGETHDESHHAAPVPPRVPPLDPSIDLRSTDDQASRHAGFESARPERTTVASESFVPPRSSPPPFRARAEPAPVGVADRVLRGAFRFARVICVLLIVLSALTVMLNVGLGAYALLPASSVGPVAAITTPNIVAFLVECAVPPQSANENPSTSNGRATATRIEIDECSEYATELDEVMSALALQDSARAVLCRRVRQMPDDDRDQFVRGLRDFALAFRARNPKGEDCDGASAANWFISEFIKLLEARDKQHAADQSSARFSDASRRALLMPALIGVGCAILGLLVFLALPLLIQIERNTRAELVLD
jgi:hypothetical protein